MATFVRNGDPGCAAENWNVKKPYAAGASSDPATFNPTKLNTTQWAEVYTRVGVKGAVLTAKHGCGHLLWPTKVVLPDGKPCMTHPCMTHPASASVLADHLASLVRIRPAYLFLPVSATPQRSNTGFGVPASSGH